MKFQLYLFRVVQKGRLHLFDLVHRTRECIVKYSKAFEAPDQTFQLAQSFSRLSDIQAIEQNLFLLVLSEDYDSKTVIKSATYRDVQDTV